MQEDNLRDKVTEYKIWQKEATGGRRKQVKLHK